MTQHLESRTLWHRIKALRVREESLVAQMCMHVNQQVEKHQKGELAFIDHMFKQTTDERASLLTPIGENPENHLSKNQNLNLQLITRRT
mmetsp:Transcript_55245/g.76607  ORF Transcript_55245/g.76607 Transcript_55245/m.76607 type:complete len:89 (+) Transcript_55245:48-314(+)